MSNEPILDPYEKDIFSRPDVVEKIREMSEAMTGFPLNDEWLDDREGMSKLVRYCRDKLRATGKIAGPSLNGLINLERLFVSIEKEMPNAAMFRQAVAHTLTESTTPSTPRNIIAMWQKLSVPVYRPNNRERQSSPWVLLAPSSNSVWEKLHTFMRAQPLAELILERFPRAS